MKKGTIFLTLLLGALAFTACEDDRDSNPTFQKPTEFILNTPKYANSVYDLSDAGAILLTCSQANYGFSAAATYAVEVATKQDFSEFTALPSTYTSARMEVDAKEMAVALVPLLGVEEKEDFPTEAFPVYVRLKSSILDAPEGNEIRSNIITLPKVKGYFALEEMELPKNMYIIGDFCSWNWDKAISMTPIHSNPDKWWAMVWCEEGKGMKFNTATSWNGGQFGVADNVTITGIEYTKSDDGNIIFTNSNWHLVKVTATIEGRGYTYNVDFSEPNIYVYGTANGKTGDARWSDYPEWKFEVPADGNSDFVSPPLKVDCDGSEDACLRLCVRLEGFDWWKTEFIFFDGKIAYRGAGNDQKRIGSAAGQKVHLNFATGTAHLE